MKQTYYFRITKCSFKFNRENNRKNRKRENQYTNNRNIDLCVKSYIIFLNTLINDI